PEHIHRMPEADLFKSHDERDHIPALVALPEAVPQVLRRRDHKGRLAVIVERAAADQVLPLALELDASPPAQVRQWYPLQLSKLVIGDSGHGFRLRAGNPVK